MYVPEIIEVKDLLDQCVKDSLIQAWELPYENLLTRRSAAIFFVESSNEAGLLATWRLLEKFDDFSYRENIEKKLSNMKYRVTFSQEEKEKAVISSTQEEAPTQNAG